MTQPPPSAYDPPPGEPVPQPPAQPPAAPSKPALKFGVSSFVTTVLGAIAAAVGILAVRWTQTPNGGELLGTEPKFLTLRRYLIEVGDVAQSTKPSWLIAYFSWAAFVLLGLLLAVALLAALPTPAAGVFQALGVLLGLVSAAAAVLVPLLDNGTNGLSEYLKGGVGMYFVAGGSILMGLGAAVGPRKA